MSSVAQLPRAGRWSISRPLWVSLVLFALLIVAVVARDRLATPERPYDLDSRGPSGLLAFRTWFQEMGYRVETTGNRSFALPDGADLLFVYPNQELYRHDEADALADWVAAGGTAVLIGVDDPELLVEFAYGYGAPNLDLGTDVHQVQPLLPEAPVRFPQVRINRPLDLADAPAALPVLATGDDRPTAAALRRGKGLVWLLSRRHGFLNSDLLATQQAAIVPALLRTVPDGGTVVFDTYHLFGPRLDAGAAPIASLQEWLYGTPLGWATLFVGLALGLYLLLQGRRLGPALETVSPQRRREAAEYVVAMASLQQRAHLGASVARHHKRRLKVALGRSYRVSPNLADAQFVDRLRTLDGPLSDEHWADLRRLLAALSDHPAESRLVELVAEVDAWVARRPGGGRP